ncbi:MAG: hypothetical protein EAS52_13025 [Parapedobacter sp.]|nr:MAG: hypothetical protein EAS52_13025 [Parapedobacter sp.]
MINAPASGIAAISFLWFCFSGPANIQRSSKSRSKSFHWYDFSVHAKDFPEYEERFAGHVESGIVTKTDPLMGGIV